MKNPSILDYKKLSNNASKNSPAPFCTFLFVQLPRTPYAPKLQRMSLQVFNPRMSTWEWLLPPSCRHLYRNCSAATVATKAPLETLKITLGRRNHIETFHVWSDSRMGLCHSVTFLKIQENWSSERINPMGSLLNNQIKNSLQKKTIAHHGHHTHHVWVQLQLEPLTIRLPLHQALKGLKVIMTFGRFPHTFPCSFNWATSHITCRCLQLVEAS